MVAASDRDGVTLALSTRNCDDTPEGRALLWQLGPVGRPVYLLMDRAYEGDKTRALAMELGYTPVVPPKSNRKNPWDYDKQLYKQRNQVERLFRRLKRFRRIFTHYDKLDIIFLAFVYFALIVEDLNLDPLDNSSVVLIEYKDGAYKVLDFKDLSYAQKAQEEMANPSPVEVYLTVHAETVADAAGEGFP
jgi:transposase